MYEALEAGAIPVVEDEGGWRAWAEILWPPSLLRMKPWKDQYWRVISQRLLRRSYVRKVFGAGFPCPALVHWAGLEATVKGLDLDVTAKAGIDWWQDLKLRTRAAVTEAVRRAISDNA
jgi:hypothetical protein